MKLDKVLEKIGVPRLIKLQPKDCVKAVHQWREKRDEIYDRYKRKFD